MPAIGRFLGVAVLVLGCMAGGARAQDWPSDPLAAEFVYSDIDRFWAAFDRLDEGGGNPFEAYIAEGSPGLRDFVPNRRIVGPDTLLDLVLKERDYYARVRPSTLKARGYEAQIRAAYAAMKYWYPAAVFPPVYYVVGRTTSGGTASEAGMIIGIETFAEDTFRTRYGRPTADIDDLPFIVAHELIHFLQTPTPDEPTLLEQSLREGVADFVAVLIAGERVQRANGPDVYPFGEAHEAELWREFRARMHEPDLEGWLYSAAPEGRPQNLGYWMGYQIAEAFFGRATDRHAAVAEMLAITDAEAFLRRSGYRGER